MTIDPRIFIREPEDVYHSKAKDHTTSTQLKTFRDCPKTYHEQRIGLIGGPTSRSLDFGSAIHMLALEGKEAFEKHFQVGGAPVNPKTGKPYGATSDKYKAWKANVTKCVLTESQGADLQMMRISINKHEIARDLLKGDVIEGVVRVPMLGHKCQIRIDSFKSGIETIVDLKSTSDFDRFERVIRQRQYIHQGAFYANVLRHATDVMCSFCIVAVETSYPYRVGVWHIAPEAMEQAHIENLMTMEDIDICERHCKWPTGYEDVRHINTLHFEGASS